MYRDRHIVTRDRYLCEISSFNQILCNSSDTVSVSHKPYREILAMELSNHGYDYSSITNNDNLVKKFDSDPLSKCAKDLLNAHHTFRKLDRFVSNQPYRVRNASGLIDDFYLNLIDWSRRNILAVILEDTVYFWNNQTQQLQQFIKASSASDIWTSILWHHDGIHMILGSRSGNLEIWNCETKQLVKSSKHIHKSRIDAMHWNETHNILSTGGKDHLIHHYDTRIDQKVSTFSGHRQEVCGLKWQNNGTSLLASGGNDNIVCIWDARQNNCTNSGTTSNPPLFSLKTHEAAVKAIDWCPSRRGWLATGGGTLDRKLVLWDLHNSTLSMNPLCKIDTGSQICNMSWSLNHGDLELVTSHGYTQNQLVLWKIDEFVIGNQNLDGTSRSMVPFSQLKMSLSKSSNTDASISNNNNDNISPSSINKIHKFKKWTPLMHMNGHSNRVIHMARDPHGENIVTGSADETLRFWKPFTSNDKSGKDKCMDSTEKQNDSIPFLFTECTQDNTSRREYMIR